MRLSTYLVGFLATASAVLAAPDISGLPREIRECVIGNHKTGWDWSGDYNWESLSDEQFCKIDNIWPRTPTKSWWVHGVFGGCVCKRNQLSWADNRLLLGKWATWMDEKCGGHNIGQKHGTGKMCKRQP
ncbi:hypothetical protein D6C78_00842 [Aureobasidium pullulans]|uniref:Uncharacterized protein n=1 Tax=Aureobasidium pullulans TaxID=5580 RepID=A0A4S9NL28_AURPU|nr:hypothetical protein D6D29_00714 [Aureobasidium pullulans]THX81325.1 hypothetical protein D6D04_04117 [Aureobasidium pullulans]THY56887.1 hypothetical protein D6C99_02708 [Aureobasidium pullulans]TIA42811.1 hypothetical protein D6C78_00842 [Aureobasidium pullulans]